MAEADDNGFDLRLFRETVTDQVTEALGGGRQAETNLWGRLRCYERTAIAADLGAQTVQGHSLRAAPGRR